MTVEKKEQFIHLINKFKVVFAWSYKDMRGINREIVEYKIPVYQNVNSVK